MNQRVSFFKNFDGKPLSRDALVSDFIVFIVLFVQYLYFPLSHGALLLGDALLLFILAVFIAFTLLGAIFYRLQPVSVVDSFIMFFATVVFTYMALFLNGPFNVLVFILLVFLIIINITGMILSGRQYWHKNREVRRSFYTKLEWTSDRGKKATKICVICAGLIFLAIASYNSFWVPFTVQAPAGAKTTSSYWGPPSVRLVSWTSRMINLVNNDTIVVQNSTLSSHPPGFISGSFANVTNVSIAGNSYNYADYSKGARSYPNGTVFLSKTLPNLSNVNITFYYVGNMIVFQALSIGHSRLIMNYHEDDFFNTVGFFDAVSKTYLFQLLDYWNVSYFLNVESGSPVGDFPNVFDYQSTLPRCYKLLNWMVNQTERGFCKKFVGISLDFETGDQLVPVGLPGGVDLFPGSLLPKNQTWPSGMSQFEYSWYNTNEQNHTLFDEAVAAFEGVYAYASYLGYKSYLVTGGGEIRDGFDGDIDFTRCPIGPPSRNKDVSYGMMSYEDSAVGPAGRYTLYRDCIDQIHALGTQGNSILLGWLTQENGSKYYTNDEQGLERYIDDCMIAQAAGMVEIFHAPLYRMQAKWGDGAVLRLHQALNVDPKPEITFTPGPWHFDDSYLVDYAKNINYPGLFAAICIIIGIWITFFGVFDVGRRLKQS